LGVFLGWGGGGGGGGGGGLLPEKSSISGGVQPSSQNLYLFKAKICKIPYPIYDLTENFKPYFSFDLTFR